MNGQIGTKINHLLKEWPKGTVATLQWLKTQGVYRQLASQYERTGWVKKIGQGAFVRADDRHVEWTGGLYAVQVHAKLPVHVGGKTALELKGLGHFIPLGKGRTVWVFGEPGSKLPKWFSQYSWEVKVRSSMTNVLSGNEPLGLTKQDMGDYAVTVSTPERAMLEVLHLVPQVESFEHAGLLMEGLLTLRSELVQALLERCRSVKVKRLFLYLAELNNHQWFKKLNVAKVDLGAGKRVIVTGGQWDAHYQITVPLHREANSSG